jgi:hypothetical protein
MEQRLADIKNCEICGMPFGPTLPRVVDHNHKTGRVRGILCPRHNTGLGFFDTDNSLRDLIAALDYLVRTSEDRKADQPFPTRKEEIIQPT